VVQVLDSARRVTDIWLARFAIAGKAGGGQGNMTISTASERGLQQQ
jgi:hypothetical protein